MAVFTPIQQAQLTTWLEQFHLGKLINFSDTDSGIENSNFFITILQGQEHKKYVLTLFERLNETELPFYLCLMQHLAGRNIPVPKPIANKKGEILCRINGKPAVLVNHLPGHSVSTPEPQHCAQIGTMLARLHLAAQDYGLRQENLRSLKWWEQTIPLILPYLSTEQSLLIRDELAFQQHFFASADYAKLRTGVTHCDLFRNNVFFHQIDTEEKLSGIFDFYFAAYDKWLFDLAVTVNDWCLDRTTFKLNPTLTYSLLSAYHHVCPLGQLEKICWPAMLRAAALRFWISRLWDFYLPRPAQTLTPLDPNYFEQILWQHIQASSFPWID